MGAAAAVADLFGPIVEDAPGDVEEINLREWQGEAVERLRRAIVKENRKTMFVAPTGSGKTVIGAYLLRECHQKGRRGIFVCDRIPLIEQTSRTFRKYGIPHGVIQADHWKREPWQRIQIASAQTIARRGWPEDLDLIVVDEAHTVYKTIADRLLADNTIAVGLTATPFAPGLGKIYRAGVVTVRTTNQLIAEGYLAPFRIFAASEPDMTGAKVNRGEWTDNEAAARSMPIVGDLVAEYLKHAAGKKFIAFGANVAHCREIQEQMQAAGVVCGLYTYKTSDAEREQLLQEFARPGGYLQGLVSVSALAKGFDNEQVECVIVARPLRKSIAEHIQMIGRGLRKDDANPGKVCTILDHAGNTVRFWSQLSEFFEDGVSELDDGKPKKKREASASAREPIKCPKCHHVHDPRPSCPMCGTEYPKRASQIEQVAGQLSELTGLPSGSGEDRQAFYSQLLAVADQRGYTNGVGWARHRYRDRFGDWPRNLSEIRTPPTAKVKSWIRSRQIAFAKAARGAK